MKPLPFRPRGVRITVSYLDPMERARLAESLRSAPACTAEAIVHDMRQELCADHAGITLIRGRRLETVTSTDGLVA